MMMTNRQKMICWMIQCKTKFNNISTSVAVLLLFFFSYSGVLAQKQLVPLNISDETELRFDQSNFFCWENDKKQKIPLEYNELSELDFHEMKNSVPNFGFIQHDVWFNFKLCNTSPEIKRLVFSLSNPNLDEAELITFSNAKLNKKIVSLGDERAFSKRPLNVKKLAFPFSIPTGDTIEFFLRVNNGGEQFHFAPIINTDEAFLLRESGENYFLGIFFGILSFVVLFNIFMWVITKEVLSQHYSLYLIAFLFLQLSLTGFGKQYLWPDNEFLTNHANPFFASFSVFFLLRFTRDYLNLAVLTPKIDAFFKLLQYPILLCILLSLIPLNAAYISSILLVNGITFLLNIFILPVAIYAFRIGYQPAKLFFIAFFLLVVSVFAFVLKNFGILPSNFYTDFGFQFGSAAEVILFSLGIVIRFRNFQNESFDRLKEINEMKEKSNILLEQKVTERTIELEEKKKEIELKNNEIISSISYAKRIQEAILPTVEKVSHILPNSAVWFDPKDIIAGDFYWLEQKHLHGKDYTFFAVGDCTGHGVPGAMMSVLCMNSLNAALAILTEPGTAQILETCSILLNEKLSMHSKEINDGMDISIACFDPEFNKLWWSGANNPIWILRQNELIEISGTKRPVGNTISTTPFEQQIVQLESEDRLFLFSDGIIDQFGGADQKKFKKSRLRESIVNSGNLPLKEQMITIQNNLRSWQGDEEQVDDIALLITSC